MDRRKRLRSRSRHVEKAKLDRELGPVIIAAKRAWKSRRRFAERKYLREVYRLYWRWCEQGRVKALARAAARSAGLPTGRNTHPLQVLINGTARCGDVKQRSRWTRALLLAACNDVHPAHLDQFFQGNGGVAGCARRMARKRNERHWTD
jgi:hypothetical protein